MLPVDGSLYLQFSGWVLPSFITISLWDEKGGSNDTKQQASSLKSQTVIVTTLMILLLCQLPRVNCPHSEPSVANCVCVVKQNCGDTNNSAKFTFNF